MFRFPFLRLIGRAQVWVLALSMAVSLPSNATVKGRRPSTHRMANRATSPFPGIVAGGPWTEPTYPDSTDGDSMTGEDLTVRRIAIWALGPYNGSVVVVDSSTGRILSILNQRLALSDRLPAMLHL